MANETKTQDNAKTVAAKEKKERRRN